MKGRPERRKTWRVDVVLGVLLGVACFLPVGSLLFRFMIGDNARGLRLVLSEMLIVCLILFLLRYVDNRLKRISNITMIAAATVVLLPLALFACFILSGGVGD